MTSAGQLITKQSYEDLLLVSSYTKKHTAETNHIQLIRKFAKHITGKRVLDLGCGPGHHSTVFSQLGFQVTGVDYSEQMIAQAKKDNSDNSVKFIVGDMLRLSELFQPQSFDAVWAAASVIHIPEDNIEKVLQGVATIAVPNACVFISLKSGTGTHIVREDQYLNGMVVQREFTFWNKEEFLKRTDKFGFQLLEYHERKGRIFQGKPTKWLQFTFRISK